MTKNLWISCSNRSEYGLIRPLLSEMASGAHHVFNATLIVYSDALHTCDIDISRDWSGTAVNIIRWRDSGIKEGESLNEHFGRLISDFSRNDFCNCDFLIVAGDRYEAFALEQIGFFQRIPIVHLFGGDISNGGHFDDHVRHAMSHLASVHFPVNQTAYDNLIAMHQNNSRVFLIGSPVVDELASITCTPEQTNICDVLISFNPMTLQRPNTVARDVRLVLETLELLQSKISLRCLATHPNHEPGAQEILNIYSEFEGKGWFNAVQSLGSPKYLRVIRDSKMVIGNSSSQVLEVPLLGQRCLLIGDRQNGRHKPTSVVHLPSVKNVDTLSETILSMLNSDSPQPCDDYGAPGVSRNIVNLIEQLSMLSRDILTQKNSPLPSFEKASAK